MANRLYLFSAALVLAACSSAPDDTANTAVVVQSGPDYASAYDALPPIDDPQLDDPRLDGAPHAPVPVAPPAELRAPEPLPPRPAAVQRVASFTCDIDVDRTSHGLRVTPIVRADRAMSGEYSLVITKSGGAGSSDITQGGPFDAARGQSVRLSSSEFSLERGAKFRAVLKVRSGGREVCRDIRS